MTITQSKTFCEKDTAPRDPFSCGSGERCDVPKIMKSLSKSCTNKKTTTSTHSYCPLSVSKLIKLTITSVQNQRKVAFYFGGPVFCPFGGGGGVRNPPGIRAEGRLLLNNFTHHQQKRVGCGHPYFLPIVLEIFPYRWRSRLQTKLPVLLVPSSVWAPLVGIGKGKRKLKLWPSTFLCLVTKMLDYW